MLRDYHSCATTISKNCAARGRTELGRTEDLAGHRRQTRQGGPFGARTSVYGHRYVCVSREPEPRPASTVGGLLRHLRTNFLSRKGSFAPGRSGLPMGTE